MSVATEAPQETSEQFITRMALVAAESGNTHMQELVIRAALGAPTKELALQTNNYGKSRMNNPLYGGWSQFTDEREYVAAFKWPNSIKLVDHMRTDAQLSGLYRAMTYPIRGYKWLIDPNGAQPSAVQGIANDFNLDIVGQEPKARGRRQRRFNFKEFQYHALLGLMYGHMPFDMTGEYSAPSQDGDGFWHLKKLIPIMPHTIAEIHVAPDGGLEYIRQNLVNWDMVGGTFGGLIQAPPIPVSQLVWFPWEKEGANWIGRSIFRDCYKNWLIKDRLLRVDAVNHERAGGVPIAEAPPGATPAEMQRLNMLAQQFKVGEGSGGSVPSGTNFQLHRVGGGTDVINSIRYHDEAMSRLFLHMFLNLGQTETGSRALGESFIEIAHEAQQSIAGWFCEIVNEHIIEDWMDWNFANYDSAPLLKFNVEKADETLSVEDLARLVDVGLIIPDDELEDTLRHQYHLSERGTPRLNQLGESEAAQEVARAEALRMLEHQERTTGETIPAPRLRARARQRMARRS
jgi:hypothetical protein